MRVTFTVDDSINNISRRKSPCPQDTSKFRLQHRRHDPTALVAASMAADENYEGVLDVNRVGELRGQFRGAGEICPFGLGEGGFLHGVEFFGEQKGADEGR